MRFVIIASPRTGSSHLVDLLNHQRKTILCNGEIFHQERPFVHWPRREQNRGMRKVLADMRACDPVAFTEFIFSSHFDRPHVGFKIFNNHNNEILSAVIDDPSILKIVLFRSNVLAVHSSARIANRSLKWENRSGRPEIADKIMFREARFIDYCNRYTGFYRDVLAKIHAGKQPFRILRYEDINEPRLLAHLIASIGGNAEAVRLKSSHTKQNASDIVSRFLNPEDVRAFLARHDRVHWAHEGGASFQPLGDCDPQPRVTAPKRRRRRRWAGRLQKAST